MAGSEVHPHIWVLNVSHSSALPVMWFENKFRSHWTSDESPTFSLPSHTWWDEKRKVGPESSVCTDQCGNKD